jgi:hypothetical protein
MIETNAIFMRKHDEIEAEGCVVDKTVHLSTAEFDYFSRNLLRDWDFIRDNKMDSDYDAEGRRRCLLVTGEERRDGILVSSSGYDYARYSALLPNAMVVMNAERYPTLAKLSERMIAAADYVVGLASDESSEGKSLDDICKYSVSFTHLSSKYDLSFDSTSDLAQVFCQMLADRPDIRQARCGADEFLIDAEPREVAIDGEREDTQAPLPEDVEKKFAAWKNLCDGAPGNWREDNRYRQKKDGALFYIGNESGQYMQITKDGQLYAGKYECADPGIEDAVLMWSVVQKYGSYEEAFLMASQLAGQRFVSDIFQQKPSVIAQIREAKKVPPTPCKQKGGQNHEEPDL